MREVDNAATEPVGGGQREGAVSTLLAPFTATVPSRLPYPVGIARCTDVTGSGTSLTGSAVLAGSRLIGKSFRQIRTTVQMNGIWRCAVRETGNDGGRPCRVLGATMTHRATVSIAVRTRMTIPLSPPAAPPRNPMQRASNRDPVPDEAWPDSERHEEADCFDMLPMPAGRVLPFGARPSSW